MTVPLQGLVLTAVQGARLHYAHLTRRMEDTSVCFEIWNYLYYQLWKWGKALVSKAGFTMDIPTKHILSPQWKEARRSVSTLSLAPLGLS